MRVLPELVEISSIDEGFPGDLRCCLATERRMHAMIVIIIGVQSQFYGDGCAWAMALGTSPSITRLLDDTEL